MFEYLFIWKVENQAFEWAFLDFIEFFSDNFEFVFTSQEMLLNFAELFFDQVFDLFFGWGKLFSHLRMIFGGGIDKCLQVLSSIIVSWGKRYDILLTENILLFEVLLDVDGNTFFAKGQSAFFIDTKLAYQMCVMEVAFVVVDFIGIERIDEGLFAGFEGFEHG